MTEIQRESREADERVLEMLYMRDTFGLSALKISRKMGITKNTVIGALHRVNKSENGGTLGDGTMPERWWAS